MAAVSAAGLRVEGPGQGYTVRVGATTPDGLDAGLALVLLAVKSQHTGAALEVVAPRLAADGAVVSLQHGLNEETIAARVGPARTVGCLVNRAADRVAPGRILHGGSGPFVLGKLDGTRSPRVQALAARLDVVGPARVSENIWGCKWAKHVYGALLAATALVDAPVYEVVERSAAVGRRLVALVREGMAVAAAAGVRLEAFDEFDPAWYRAGAAGDGVAVERAMAAVAAPYPAHTKTRTGDLAATWRCGGGRRGWRHSSEPRSGRRRPGSRSPSRGGWRS